MKLKYFGYIDSETFINITYEERLEFLIKHNLVRSRHRLKPDKLVEPDVHGDIKMVIELSNDNQDYIYSQELCSDLRNFLLSHYTLYLGAELYQFQKKIENEIFGLNITEQKKIGLKYFNQYFFKCCDESDQRTVIVNGNRELESRFETIERKRKALANCFSEEIEIMGQYLIGNSNCFNKKVFNETDSIKDIFILENNYEILKFLNEKFEFEVNIKIFNSKLIYLQFENKFNSEKVVQFIGSIFSNEQFRDRKYGLALFECLKKELVVIQFSANEFKDLCNNFFDCNFKDLKLGYAGNSHYDKVNMFQKKWQNFILQH